MNKIFLDFLIIVLMVNVFSRPVLAEDSAVRIVSPGQAQVFAPGDTVDITVEFPSKLHATDGSVSTPGMGSLQAREFSGTHFKADLVIPESYAGPLELIPWVYAAGEVVAGASLTIHVRPKTAPQELRFSNRNNFPSPDAKDVQIYVTGLYPEGIHRDLSSSVTGTTFTSSNTAVITVDGNGLSTITGKGQAVVTVEHNGVRGFVMFVVEDPKNPNPALDITDKVSIVCANQREEMAGHRVIQEVTVTNTTDLPMVGPFFLEAIDVPDGARSYGDVFSFSPADGLNLFPGESVTLEATFLLWQEADIGCQFKLYDHDPA